MTTIKIAGIILDRDGLEPLPGVQVRETKSRRRQITDANGFYSMELPVDPGKPGIKLDFTKDGYLNYSRGVGFRPEDIPLSRILIDILYSATTGLKEEYLHSIPQDGPANPDFADTLAALENVRTDHWITIRFREMWKARPEISLFYVSKDSHRRFVLYRDGRVESYGGAGEPDFATMDARYAPLPWYMVRISKEPPKKPSFWQDISRRVQKDFQPTGGDAKAIVFPGDGNIIVVPEQGDAEFYEMVDAGAPQGRSAFEARFGPLPDYIPIAVKRPGERSWDISYDLGDGTGVHEIRTISTAKR
jgi:hypothetical protein